MAMSVRVSECYAQGLRKKILFEIYMDTMWPLVLGLVKFTVRVCGKLFLFEIYMDTMWP